MHRVYLLILVTSAAMWAADITPDAKKAVAAAEKSWVDAVMKGDRAKLDKLLGDDLSYTHSSLKTQTKKEFLDDATGGGTTYKSIQFSDAKMRQFGNTVIVTEMADIDTVQTGASHLYITEVWAKQGGGWQLVSRQATKPPAVK